MDPRTVLRFVRATGGWPGRVFVVACEPGPRVEAAVERAVELVAETVEELRCTSCR